MDGRVSLTSQHIEDWVSQLSQLDQPFLWQNQAGQGFAIPAWQAGSLGSESFCRDYQLKLPYMVGAMAHGIASADLVRVMAQAGYLGSFGAAGLSLARVRAELLELKARLGSRSFAVNFIHSPQEPELEWQLAELLLELQIPLVEASAFMKLSPALIYYRCKGLRRDEAGQVIQPQRILGKASRVEVARQFWSPAPAPILEQLVTMGKITRAEAELAQTLPVAQDLCAEADSGGHTDNRPMVTLVPHFLQLRAELQQKWQYSLDLRLGAAGGIATPHAAFAAFVMGADYIVAGTIHQASLESGTSEAVKELLAESSQGDIAMAPAADMFEMGVKVQVLKRGTMFAMRAQRLYELYRQHADLESLSVKDQQMLEEHIFRQPIASAWAETKAYFAQKDPGQIVRAEREPKHKMALLFRSYLGQASHWATQGRPERKVDYQIWCGPAMAAFNDWTKGTFLAAAKAREAVLIADNIMFHAALLSRVQVLRSLGAQGQVSEANLRPKSAEELRARSRRFFDRT